MNLIRGSVARVISDTTLIINRGKDHGVELGMRFLVLNERGQNIIDPETGESLGDAEIVKAYVKVVELKDKMSIARTFRTYTSNPIAAYTSLFGKQVTERFEVDADVESTVNVSDGDAVVQFVATENSAE